MATFAQNFSDWCNQEVMVQSWLGTFSVDGEPQYGAPMAVKCYIESRVRLVTDMQGEERAANTTLYLLGGPFDSQDKFTMPASFHGPSEPTVLSVLNLFDTNGVHDHSEVLL